MAEQNKIGTVYVAHAENWLNKELWVAEIDPGDMPAKKQLIFFPIESPQFEAWKEYKMATTGRGPFIIERKDDRKRGSWFENDWPPPLPVAA